LCPLLQPGCYTLAVTSGRYKRNTAVLSMLAKSTTSTILIELIDIAERIAEPFGLSVVDVRFSQQGKRRTLEITIFKKDGAVSLDDCEKVSKAIERELDERQQSGQSAPEGAYLLEVQSPGIDRKLCTDRDFRIFAGERVEVQSKEKIGQLAFTVTGTLVGLADQIVTLHDVRAVEKKPGKEPGKSLSQVQLNLQDLTQVKLHPKEIRSLNER